MDIVNSEYEEKMEDFMGTQEIVTFEGGQYTNDIRTLYMELMTMNVGARNVEDIIR